MNPVTPSGRPLGPHAKARLAAEIVVTYLHVRRHLRRTDFRGALRALRNGRVCPVTVADPARSGARLGRAVVRTLSVLPTDTRCLMRSLVLSRLLYRRGIDARLVIGVTSGTEFHAHAWVEHRGRALLPPGGPGFGRLAEL